MNAPVADARRPPSLRPRPTAPSSGIVEVFNYGRDREGLIPLWVGEGDLPTPAFICEAATRRSPAARPSTPSSAASRSCARRWRATTSGSTGVRPIRSASSSRSAACMRADGGAHGGRAGDEVLIPTPAWPNFGGAITVRRAPGRVPLPTTSRLAARPRPPRRRDDAAHARHRRQLAGQPDRLDREPRRAPRRSSRSPAGAACGSSPTRSTPASSTTRR